MKQLQQTRPLSLPCFFSKYSLHVPDRAQAAESQALGCCQRSEWGGPQTKPGTKQHTVSSRWRWRGEVCPPAARMAGEGLLSTAAPELGMGRRAGPAGQAAGVQHGGPEQAVPGASRRPRQARGQRGPERRSAGAGPELGGGTLPAAVTVGRHVL